MRILAGNVFSVLYVEEEKESALCSLIKQYLQNSLNKIAMNNDKNVIPCLQQWEKAKINWQAKQGLQTLRPSRDLHTISQDIDPQGPRKNIE